MKQELQNLRVGGGGPTTKEVKHQRLNLPFHAIHWIIAHGRH